MLIDVIYTGLQLIDRINILTCFYLLIILKDDEIFTLVFMQVLPGFLLLPGFFGNGQGTNRRGRLNDTQKILLRRGRLYQQQLDKLLGGHL
jgi:hypothetical protein